MKHTAPKNKLPDGILVSDTDLRPDKDRVYGLDFELWHVGDWGWCIPTLLIRNAPRRRVSWSNQSAPPRTYAIRVDKGEIVRVGLGPHVTERVTIYVRKNRQAALQKYLDMREKGAEGAGIVRDRISSRRARFALMRHERGW